MFKKLFGGILDAGDEQKKKSAYEAEKLRMLAKFFPIGRKLRYYPEYHREITLRTIILAYRINEHYLYSKDTVVLDDDHSLLGFHTGGKKLLAPEAVDRLFVVVPDTSEMVRQLDYLTRAELGTGGQFRQGNTITLVAETVERSVPSLDTTVHRRLELKEGPYANSPVILLAPDLTSLAVTDKRKQQRVSAALELMLYYGRDAEYRIAAMLRDFAENALRIELHEEATEALGLHLGDRVYVEFSLDSSELPYRLEGRLIRLETAQCVVRIERMFDDGEFRKLHLIDIVEIKTQLLNTGC